MSCEGCPSAGNCGKDQNACGVQPNPHNKIKYIVAVMSGKGGVGKSTITTGLARALAKQGKKVGIMDADITGPSIPRMMSMEDHQAYANNENFILPVISQDGVEIMSLNYMLSDENEPVVWRGPIVANVVKQLYTDVIWGELDVLLIDMPPGTGDVALTILQELPVTGVLMVSTPQPMVSMIVTKAIRMCEKMNIRVLGVVENMAYLTCPHCDEKIFFAPEGELDKFAEDNKVRLMKTLPMVDVLRSLNEYDSYNLKQQEEVQTFFKEIADDVIEELESTK